MNVDAEQLRKLLTPPKTTPGDVQDYTLQQDVLPKGDCNSPAVHYSHTGMHDSEPLHALKEVPPLPQPTKLTMLDPGYNYNPYPDHD